MIRLSILALVLALPVSSTQTAVSISDYGARSGAISTTGSGRGTALSVGVSTFQDGDGVTILGAGAAPTMPQPATPTITSGCTKSLTQIDAPVASLSGGSSSYRYKVIARDVNGGLSLPSGPLTIVRGPAKLGETRIPVSSLSATGVARSYPFGYVMTVDTQTAHGLASGCLVHITANTDTTHFGGWWPVHAIPDAQRFTVLSPYLRFAASARGGYATYFIANQIKWTAVSGAFDYLICAERPADRAYHVIGVSFPSDPDFRSTTFDDFGPGFQTGPVPWDVSDAACNATQPKNDNFTTRVLNGGGSTNLTLAARMPHAVTRVAVRLDAAPGIAAAQAANQGQLPIYVPAGNYQINSNLSLAYTKMLLQTGELIVNDTIQMSSAVRWAGWGQNAWGPGQFSYSDNALVQCAAYPCVMVVGGPDRFDNLTFRLPANNLAVVQDQGFPGSTFKYVTFTSEGSGSADNDGMAFVVYPGGYDYEFDHTSFIFGPDQVIDQTWTPFLYSVPAYSGCCGSAGSASGFQFNDVMMNRRGVLVMANGGSGIDLDCQHCYRQGGITPMFMVQNEYGVINTQIRIDYASHDTESQALLALFGGIGGQIEYSFVNAVSTDNTGRPAQVTGGTQFTAGPGYVAINPSVPAALAGHTQNP